MITYLVTRQHAYTMRTYLSVWGNRHGPRIRVVSYEYLLRTNDPGCGPVICSDIERLGKDRAAALARLWDTPAKANPAVSRRLNHPVSSMRRYELIRTLHDRGTNDYTLYRPHEDLRDIRFPVFLRYENDHEGSRSPLLHTHEDLAHAMNRLISRGGQDHEFVIVEFCDTSDANGIFRKYSAYSVGDRIVPRHIMFSRNWLVKQVTDLAHEEPDLREEREYVFKNPHEQELRTIFDLAGIQYGRADYALLNGKIQVWEINTNPTVIGIGAVSPKRRDVRLHFLHQLTTAFEEFDSAGKQPDVRPFRLAPERSGIGQDLARWTAHLIDGYYIFRHGAGRIADRLRYGTDKGLR